VCALAVNASAGAVTLNGTVQFRRYESNAHGGRVLVQADTLLPSTGTIDVRGQAGGRVAIHARAAPPEFLGANASQWPLVVLASSSQILSPYPWAWPDMGMPGVVYTRLGAAPARVLVLGSKVSFYQQYNGYRTAIAFSAYLPLPRNEAVRLAEVGVVDAAGYTPRQETGDGSNLDVSVLQVDAAWSTESGPLVLSADPGRYSVGDTEVSRLVLMQLPGTPLYTPLTFTPVAGFAVVGVQLASVLATSEARCGLACCEAPGCAGYSFTAETVSALPLAAWNGMASPWVRHNCFLVGNVTALAPNLLVRSGVVRAAVASMGAAAGDGGPGAGSPAS
jgi:hypothetical protein